jgi:hypothetical protein
MEINGLYAEINMPPALSGDGLNALPPHCKVQAFPVDEFPACPNNWMHGSGKASSYFVMATVDRGMWFDFTMNSGHRYDLAIVVSVQGINPVTGKKVTQLNLEQYREKCPVHNVAFQQDRFCPECNYNWPTQNYISTTTGQMLWIDGFRNEKGEVRQYIITEDNTRGVAAQVIGDDRVWAIGFAFYLSKEPRKLGPYLGLPSLGAKSLTMSDEYSKSISSGSLPEYDANMTDVDYFMPIHPDVNGPSGPSGSAGTYGPCGDGGSKFNMASTQHVNCSCSKGAMHRSLKTGGGIIRAQSMMAPRAITAPMTQQKMLEIGAGARIDQEIGVDPNPIDYWQAEPIGLIYCNYVDGTMFRQILKAGQRQVKKEGPLAGLKIGN